MPRTPRLFLVAVLAVCGAFAMTPSGAHASKDQLSIMMDDDLLVYRDDNTAGRSLRQMKSLGVDTVRVTMLWRVAAELADPTEAEIKAVKSKATRERLRKQGRRFRADNPATYPAANWDRYDNLVKQAQELGIQVYFNITGPGPRWAHETAPKSQRRNQPTWKPKAREFKKFVTAVGKRYSGTYRDENATRGALPRVKFWSLWNEPNQAGWLSPQWEQKGNTRYAASPAIYRKLHQEGYKGLVASGHRVDNDIILMGETAPLGSNKKTSRSPMFPGKFLRELACLDDKGNKYKGNGAKLRDCGRVSASRAIQANGFAHHPYTKNVAPTVKPSAKDALTMANISDLGTQLDGLSAKTGGFIKKDLPLFMTEFGFESNPPDPFSGVPLDKQAKYNVSGEYIGYQNPRIAAMAQFILRDVAPVAGKPKTSKAYWFTYQSGLFSLDGKPKPAAFAYTMPLIVTPTAREPGTGNARAAMWGQLRFLPNGTAGGPSPGSAQIQWRPAGNPNGAWTSVGNPVPVDARGFYTTVATAPSPAPPEWRAVWFTADGRLGQSSLSSTGQ